MKTLMLLRHAKSDWSAAGLADHDRPLNARGEAAAQRMGHYLAAEGLRPDLILCSTALRTRETLARLLDAADGAFTPPAALRYEKSLYLASPRTMLQLAQATPDSIDCLMLIGHNPGTHALANDLAAIESKRARADMTEKFPTGALAVIEFDGSWRELAPGGGRLLRFIRPKALGPL